MAHAVESMCYSGAIPWHGIGERIPENCTNWRECAIAAGLDWTVTLTDLFTLTHDALPMHVKGFHCVRRDSDNAILGVVGSEYKVLQNSDAFQWFTPFVQSGNAYYHTAGSLEYGAKVWVLAKMHGANNEIVSGDEIERYILLSHAHNGKMSIRVGFTPIRVVCANTLAMAHSNKQSKLIRIMHSGKMQHDMHAVRDVMNAANATFEATAEQYRRLASKTINTKDVKEYVRKVFQIEADTNSRILPAILRYFEDGKGNNLPGVRGTLWSAYNSVTEYLSWESGNAVGTRYNSLWFGVNAEVNERALREALILAA